MLIDVRQAHFYSPARRKVFVEIPEEGPTLTRAKLDVCSGVCAAANWEFAICQVMIAIGFVQGGASPCIYRHLEKQLRVWVHGDDFVPLNYIVNVRCFFVVQSIRMLGRIVDWEADPRHAELIRKSFGVTGRSVTTPGVRNRLTDIEGEVPIDKEASDRYRANTVRASSDRPDLQIECRDLARKMQQPSNLDEMGLKRLARFLGVRPRLGCSSGRSVLHESTLGVIQTMQAVSELGRMFLVVR